MDRNLDGAQREGLGQAAARPGRDRAVHEPVLRRKRLGRRLADAVPEPPDEHGEFPTRFGANGRMLHLSQSPAPLALIVRPVVVDANVLRDDIRRALRTGCRTALLDAAESDGMRVFCAEHVAAEVDEHLADWVGDDFDQGFAAAIWAQQYLRVLRVVSPPAVPALHPDEARRVEWLKRKDPDDVPTAVLAVLLGVPVLSKDKPLLHAVHGEDADVGVLAEWLGLALAGRVLGDADAQMVSAVLATTLVGRGAVAGTAAIVRGIRLLPPLLQGVLLGAVGAWLVSDRRRIRATVSAARVGLRQARERLRPIFEVIGVWVAEHGEASALLLDAAPPPALAGTVGGLPSLPEGPSEAVLTRLVCYTLARAPESMSAADLADSLPGLVVPTGSAEIRAVLRSGNCFHALPRDRWQMGRPWGRLGWSTRSGDE